MKSIYLSLLFFFIASAIFGQGAFPNLTLMKVEELAEMVKRPLLILEYKEALFRSNDVQKKLAKAEGEKLDRLNTYDSELKSTDKVIKENLLAITKDIWKYNNLDGVRVITHDEALEMRKKKNKDYCILMIRSFGNDYSHLDTYRVESVPGAAFTCMVIQESEAYGNNASLVGFPVIYTNDGSAHSKAEIETTMRVLNHLVGETLKEGKGFSTKDYIQSEIVNNCSMKSELKLHVNRDLLKDVEERQIDDAWPGSILLENTQPFVSSISSTQTDAYAVLVPVSAATGSLGPITSTVLIYGRIAIQPSSGKILGFGKTKMGEKAGERFFKESHFVDMGACE